MKKILFLLTLIASLISRDIYKQIRIYSDDRELIKTLRYSGLEIDHMSREPGLWIEFVVSSSKLYHLDQLEIHYDIIHDDIEKFYSTRLINNYESRDFELGSMGGYYTFDEIEQQLDNLYNDFPNIISEKISLGLSLEGRNIWMVKISDNPNIDEDEPEALYTGLHHSREPMSYMNLFYFMNWLTENYGLDSEATALVNNRELYFIPAINPDGLVYNYEIAPNGGAMQRKNMRQTCSSSPTGVDLNRNYSYMWGYDDSGSSPDGCNETYRGSLPFSEPETQIIKNFIEEHNFPIALNYHSYSNLLIYPLGYTYDNPVPQEDLEIFIEYGQEMVKFIGYALGTGPVLLYTVNGEACDWMYGEHDIFAYTPEIGSSSDGFWPATNRIIPLAEENLHPNKFVAWSVGSHYSLNFSIPEGSYIPGEEYDTDLSIFNSGLGDSNGSIALSVDSPDGFISFETEFIEIGNLESRESFDLGDIISFQISPTAPNGYISEINLYISDEDNYEYLTTYEIIIGQPIILESFDFENINGWSVGDIDDNASAGIWEATIPIATSFEGNQAQPSSDHSIYGDICFITGGATSPGNVGFDDVDGGKTTLFSPLFDLSAYDDALISYWRWYTNDAGDNPGTDLWRVDVTSDGWQTYASIESTNQSQAQWIEKTFLLSTVDIDINNIIQFRFVAEDIFNNGDSGSGGSIIEAAVDDFSISVFSSNNQGIEGDLNIDGILNVLDVVILVNCVLDLNCLELADLNQDDGYNVLDIVLLVNMILR